MHFWTVWVLDINSIAVPYYMYGCISQTKRNLVLGCSFLHNHMKERERETLVRRPSGMVVKLNSD